MAPYPTGATRGVYYGGMLHYLSSDYDNQGNHICHYQKAVDPRYWEGPWVNNDHPTSTQALPNGWRVAQPGLENEYGQGVVLSGSLLINFAVAFDGSKKPNLLVTRYDLAANKFIDIRGVYTLTSSVYNGWGAAAAIYNGKIYAFLSECTMVSEDGGKTFSTLPAVADGISSYQPMDAVTFYPTDGTPKVMVLFSTCKSGAAGYVIWDGSTLPMPKSSFKTISSGYTFQAGALMVGSAHSGGTNVCSFDSGDKAVCVQIFLMNWFFMTGGGNANLVHYEYNSHANTVKSKGTCILLNEWTSVNAFRVFPWFKTTVDSKTGFYDIQQEIVINVKICNSKEPCIEPWQNFATASDFMVPQNYDSYEGGYGWQGVPTVTTAGGDATEEKIRRNYWSLAGVILGPPPFATNGLEDFEIRDVSNVTYGGGGSSSVQHKHSWDNSFMISSETQVYAGIKDVFGFSAEFDASYKYGMEGENTQAQKYTADYNYICGTKDETGPDWGNHGWAIFIAPTLLTQYMEIYAYDYKSDGSAGTKLGQNLTSIVAAGASGDGNTPAINVLACKFRLDNPGSDYDTYPDLMNGIGPFPSSLRLNDWEEMVWEYPTMPWKVIYGSGAMGGGQVAPFHLGNVADYYFTSTATSEESNGTTNSIDIKAGFGIMLGTKLLGIKETLNAGYDCQWSNTTTTETEISENIKFGYGMPGPPDDCDNPEYVHDIEVQPYLLMAQSEDYSEPWIPDNYNLNRPWCITWKVNSFKNCFVHIGGGPPPDKADGDINGSLTYSEGFPEEALGKKWSSYSISGGHMVWKNSDGTLEPIPMTADQFDPALGASVKLNSYLFKTDLSSGKWTKNGEVWKFKTKSSSKSDIVTLKLDFSSRTWSFEGEKLSLSGHLKAGDSHSRVALDINGKYRFSSVIVQDLKAEWELLTPQTDPLKLSLTEYSGCFGWSDREDKLTLEGKLPATIESCGDISFILNGHRRDFFLLANEEFVDAFAKGKEFVFKEGDTKLVVDFKKKTWSAQFKKLDFSKLMAPRNGKAKIEIKVGGSTVYSHEHPISKFHTKVSYKA